MARQWEGLQTTAIQDQATRDALYRIDQYLRQRTGVDAAFPQENNPSLGGGGAPLRIHTHEDDSQGGNTLGGKYKEMLARGSWHYQGDRVDPTLDPDAIIHILGGDATTVEAVPNATRTPNLNWRNEAAGTADLHTSTGDDSDSTWIINDPLNSATITLDLSDQPDPGTDAGFTLRFRAELVVDTGATESITYTLKQLPSTTVKSDNINVDGSSGITNFDTALSEAEIANLTDFSDLAIDISVGGSGSTDIKIYRISLIFPDSAASGTEVLTKLEGGISQDKDWLQFANVDGETIGLRIPNSGITDYSVVLPSAQGAASSVLLNDGSGNLSWSTTPAAHALLSATHTDTVVNSVSAGSIIIGNATPAWDELTIGSNGDVLTVSSGLPAWVTPAAATNALLDGTNHTDTEAHTAVRGDVIVVNSSGNWDGVALGTNLQILQSDATDLAYADPIIFPREEYDPSSPVPDAVVAGTARLFGEGWDDDGLVIPAMAFTHDRMKHVAPRIGHVRTSYFRACERSEVAFGISGWGAGVSVSLASQSLPAITTTNLLTSTKRVLFGDGGAFGRSYINETQDQFWRGDAAGLGGFYICSRFNWVIDTDNDEQFAFCGLNDNPATDWGSGNLPSAWANLVGVTTEDGDANQMFVIHNDNAGNATRTTLSTNFQAGSTDVYQLELYCPQNGDEIYWRVQRLDDLTIAPESGVFSSDIPSDTTFLRFTCGEGSGSGAIVPGAWNFISYYSEIDV